MAKSKYQPPQAPKFKNLEEMKAAFMKSYKEYQEADAETRKRLKAELELRDRPLQ